MLHAGTRHLPYLTWIYCMLPGLSHLTVSLCILLPLPGRRLPRPNCHINFATCSHQPTQTLELLL